jgi:hypothetical protein
VWTCARPNEYSVKFRLFSRKISSNSVIAFPAAARGQSAL